METDIFVGEAAKQIWWENAKKIQEYIRNQIQEDLEYDQISLKEYIDPFTGEPVNLGKKIKEPKGLGQQMQCGW